MATILIVDDNRNVLAYWSRELASAGHEVRVASDSDEALLAMAARRPDVVILDLEVPRIRRFSRWVLEQEGIPVVVYALSTEGASHVGHGAVVGFAHKADDPQVLIGVLTRSLLQRPHSADATDKQRASAAMPR